VLGSVRNGTALFPARMMRGFTLEAGTNRHRTKRVKSTREWYETERRRNTAKRFNNTTASA
jgi:hypothetical protein